MEIKQFNNETEAKIFRDAKRQEGLAASLFTYGKDRFRVKAIDTTSDRNPGWTQRYLSNQAIDVSNDIESLNKVKALIANPDFGCNVEDLVLVVKKLNKENWFKTPDDVINFIDGGPSQRELDKIKETIDTALKEYDEEWNDKSEVNANV